jgi:cation diffusion facilitator CzcD-associated flavoprotein CzcO
LTARIADKPIPTPKELPTWTPKSTVYRFAETSIYPTLETNITAQAMEFSQEPIPDIKSELSIQRHGEDTPFRHHSVIQQYIEDIVHPHENLVRYNTTVERIEKNGDKWYLTLRETDSLRDYWRTESFDAFIFASGHHIVPFVPDIEGLAGFAERYSGHAEHSKSFQDPEKYSGKGCTTSPCCIPRAKLCRGSSPLEHQSQDPTLQRH